MVKVFLGSGSKTAAEADYQQEKTTHASHVYECRANTNITLLLTKSSDSRGLQKAPAVIEKHPMCVGAEASLCNKPEN